MSHLISLHVLYNILYLTTIHHWMNELNFQRDTQGSSTNLSGSVPSLPDEGSTANTEVSKVTAHGSAPARHGSIKTAAKNLVRVFSLEDRLKEELEFSQDEFASKIAQFLMDVSVGH